MKDIILVNTSRGGIIEKCGLEYALDAGNVKFFGADVYWEEPLQAPQVSSHLYKIY